MAIRSCAEADFLDALRRFGDCTAEVQEGGLRYFINAFWTAGQRQGHSLHEVSYRACFKPQLPAFFIERLTAPGERVYDPFSGRGTTAVQAALMGRAPAANDINPLSAMLCEPRLDPPEVEAVRRRLEGIDLAGRLPLEGTDLASRPPLEAACRGLPQQVACWPSGAVDPPTALDDVLGNDLLAFYHPETLRAILTLRAWLLDRAAALERADGLDRVVRWIRLVALNRLTGHSPGFFSVYTMPPNQAVSAASQRRINADRGQAPPVRDVRALILRKTLRLLADGPPPPHPPALLLTGPADRTPALADGSVALVVTSPPFLDVVDYEGDNWLRCWFAGIDPGTVAIDRHRDIRAWEGFIRRVFGELARVVRPGGFVAFEVGEVRGGKVLLERHVVAAMQGLPFEVLGVMVNQQSFTKTANCWGVNNNRGGTNTNRIVLAVRR